MENIDTFFEEISHYNRFNQLAYKFFVCYSRFEYSLKRANYIHFPGVKNIPQASFDKFISSIEQSIDLDGQTIKDHINYIVDNPPNVLHYIDDRLHWIPLTPQSKDIDFILRCMRTVRNNLFHGNKQLPGNSVQRNINLISSFLTILDYLIEQNKEVRNYFLSSLED